MTVRLCDTGVRWSGVHTVIPLSLIANCCTKIVRVHCYFCSTYSSNLVTVCQYSVSTDTCIGALCRVPTAIPLLELNLTLLSYFLSLFPLLSLCLNWTADWYLKQLDWLIQLTLRLNITFTLLLLCLPATPQGIVPVYTSKYVGRILERYTGGYLFFGDN